MSIPPDLPLNLLGNLTPQEFLKNFWQKKPLLIKKALPGYKSPISADELAGLSLEESVESRIILENGETPWELRHGPFKESIYTQLPEKNWTLLVQAVDQFVPELNDLLSKFQFLPTWRIDDIMISYAVDGGSVGPHYDNYDVFLLQVEGKRHWKLGQLCDANSQLIEHPDLRILANFEQNEAFLLEPGDMLYLPPRLAHYGIAQGESLTFSVGFRAPSVNEILTGFTDFIGQFISDDIRYCDANRLATKKPHQIESGDINNLKEAISKYLNDEDLLTTWFGQFMTEPRYPELVASNEIDFEYLFNYLSEGGVLIKNPSARLAWSEHGGYLQLFSSGGSRYLDSSLKKLIELFCTETELTMNELVDWLDNDDALTLIHELVKQGSWETLDYE